MYGYVAVLEVTKTDSLCHCNVLIVSVFCFLSLDTCIPIDPVKLSCILVLYVGYHTKFTRPNCKLKKDRQFNGQAKNTKRTNTEQRST